ncbi:hypothetical protein BHM03_00026716 [Ensete ventricosum]|nr:hypothetical protein BHM03_00026716 [Ensete ventricosum]
MWKAVKNETALLMKAIYPLSVVEGEQEGSLSHLPLGLRLLSVKLAEGIRSLLGVRRELTEGIRGLLGVSLLEAYRRYQKLAGVRRGLAECNRELVRMTLGVCRKKMKRLIGRSSGVVEKLTESQEGLAGLDSHMIIIN